MEPRSVNAICGIFGTARGRRLWAPTIMDEEPVAAAAFYLKFDPATWNYWRAAGFPRQCERASN
eukprot:SAG31_NODE_993_length_10512_cov_20.777202_8_plen_64_part_00